MTADNYLALVISDCVSLHHLEPLLKVVPTEVLFSRILKELSVDSPNSLVRLIYTVCN